MKRPRTHVTDHAIIRYLERVGGFDIDRLRVDIARRVESAALAGASGVVVDGFIYKVQHDQHGPVITTVLPTGSCPASDGFRPGAKR